MKTVLPLTQKQSYYALGKKMLIFYTLSIMGFVSCNKDKDIVAVPAANIPATTTTIPTPVTPAVSYTNTFNPSITFSNYTYNSGTAKNFIGKLYPSTLVGKAFFSEADANYVYFKNDSLFLTETGKTKIIAEKFLNIDLLFTDSINYKKSFTLVYDQFLTNKVIAHKGAFVKLGLPENSLAALKQAFVIGTQGSEFDVHLTLDKVVVVSHDDVFGGISIEKSTYQELCAKKLSNGETIPTLLSFLTATVTQNRTRLDLEIKQSVISNAAGIELTDSVLSLVNRTKAQAWVRYTSYGSDILAHIAKVDVTSTTEYLSGTLSATQLKGLGITGMDFSYDIYQKNETLIADARKNGLFLSSFTINDPVVMLWWLSKNPDGIVTDQPELALQYSK
ncbi:glycerophosphodiester phosphodiesterase [Mucilaginibacter boryungensis]|uniref:GP-PDE domain-containing protein n=1 Tax=Mucilaginibacter boryungensis TaxID=768480 RepID=A0ABR9XLD7_9SPHI|nr:glycerophosphodiester phosphodiesterase family protein [Mucilaginibacter boryungensis]MBE9667884.1 hypothetical protein [Mucilaginibacter boryungensis]